MNECFSVLLAAFFLDIFLGDPEYALHPVRLVGKSIHFVEVFLCRAGLRGIIGGILLVLIVLSLSIGSYLGLRSVLQWLFPWFGIILDIFMVYSCLALRDLIRYARSVAHSLKRDDLVEARSRVQRMVGRDASLLDAAGVIRATIESLAENFVDGFLSPVFWYVLGGAAAKILGIFPLGGAVLGILIFRVVNTLDSMVGHLSERYRFFGRASARLDDMMNFLPARISVMIIAAASYICGLEAKNCLKMGWRDRLKHPSPNAGHAESCAAAALHIRLGGPTVYPDRIVQKPWLGHDTTSISQQHIHKCCVLILWSGLITLGVSLLVVGIFV
jgi:adenosylcobinamide-phosphate synthase